MKFSLLKKNEENTEMCRIVYDLSIDRAISALSPDRKHTEYFLDVVSNPLKDIGNIIYRQQIYSDFAANPELFDELKLTFTRYDRIKSDWHEMKLGAAPSSDGIFNPEALLEHTYSSLKITSAFPGTIVSFFNSISETLSKYEIKSDGLSSVLKWCSEMKENEAFDEIVNIAQLFRYHSPEHYDFDMLSEIDNTLRLCGCKLCGISEHKKEKEGVFKKLFGKKDSGAESIELSENAKSSVDDDYYSDGILMLNESLSQIDKALTKVTDDIYDVFFGISREMLFYETALYCFGSANDLGIPVCMPELLEESEDVISANRLYDLLLYSERKRSDEIVPNDIFIDKSYGGMLVKGNTDSGKTVFLRSVGTAMLFAQAGLPVLADSAKFSIRRAFFSHFSSAEEKFKAGDTSGRFESEAKEIAGIIDSIVPYSFVLLNETFQTTAYSEGTDGIYNIINVLPEIKTKYIFVTHLTGLFDLMRGHDVILAHTDPEQKYKIIIQPS